MKEEAILSITAPIPQMRKLRLSHANCPQLYSQEMEEI